MKILLAHPGKQHSFETATALKKNGMLYKYVTSVYIKDGSYTNKVQSILRGNNKKKALGRSCAALSADDVIQFNEGLFLVLLLISKIPNTMPLWRYLNDRFTDSFGKKVAEYAIRENVDAVICYDSNSMVLFDILKRKAPHIKRIMDVSTANRLFMKDEFDKYIKKGGESSIRKEQSFLWKKTKQNRFFREIRDTEYFLVPSQFVKESLLYSGIRREQIAVVPYGVDLEKFRYQKKKAFHGNLKLVYVGQITYKKGIDYMLKVISQFPNDRVSITLAGAYNTSNHIYRKYKNCRNIKFLGFVTRDILAQVYHEADVFVFPTLGEGFGMVVLEAMGCGLPAIVSDHAGGNDVVAAGKNGFEFEAGNEKMLKDKIEWFLNNPDRLPEMSENAYHTAKNYTWDRYHEMVSKAIARMIEGCLPDIL